MQHTSAEGSTRSRDINEKYSLDIELWIYISCRSLRIPDSRFQARIHLPVYGNLRRNRYICRFVTKIEVLRSVIGIQALVVVPAMCTCASAADEFIFICTRVGRLSRKCSAAVCMVIKL